MHPVCSLSVAGLGVPSPARWLEVKGGGVLPGATLSLLTSLAVTFYKIIINPFTASNTYVLTACWHV